MVNDDIRVTGHNRVYVTAVIHSVYYGITLWNIMEYKTWYMKHEENRILTPNFSFSHLQTAQTWCHVAERKKLHDYKFIMYVLPAVLTCSHSLIFSSDFIILIRFQSASPSFSSLNHCSVHLHINCFHPPVYVHNVYYLIRVLYLKTMLKNNVKMMTKK